MPLFDKRNCLLEKSTLTVCTENFYEENNSCETCVAWEGSIGFFIFIGLIGLLVLIYLGIFVARLIGKERKRRNSHGAGSSDHTHHKTSTFSQFKRGLSTRLSMVQHWETENEQVELACHPALVAIMT